MTANNYGTDYDLFGVRRMKSLNYCRYGDRSKMCRKFPIIWFSSTHNLQFTNANSFDSVRFQSQSTIEIIWTIALERWKKKKCHGRQESWFGRMPSGSQRCPQDAVNENGHCVEQVFGCRAFRICTHMVRSLQQNWYAIKTWSASNHKVIKDAM